MYVNEISPATRSGGDKANTFSVGSETQKCDEAHRDFCGQLKKTVVSENGAPSWKGVSCFP